MSFKDNLLHSIKEAMKAEMDSITLYSNAASHCSDKAVMSFFIDRMNEEKLHYNYLLQYYKELTSHQESPELSDIHIINSETLSPVISMDFLKQIGKDQILFSAISTAILLEKNAIDFYKQCAKDTDILIMQNFFNRLAEWEAKHYQDLVEVQKDAEVYYWEINQFHPF